MPKLILPFTISSNSDAGTVTAVTSAVGSTTLAKGLYKIAAVNVDFLWKLGSTNVSVSTGAYLASGDQEVIRVDADSTKLSWIRATHASADGQINIVPVEIYEIPGQDYRNYG